MNLKFNYVALFLISFIFLMGVLPDTSYACSCVKPGSPQEELEQNTAVFSGEVVKIVDVNKNKKIHSSADPIAVQLEVDQSWKGIDQTQIIVYTERSSASCGYEFELNERYLVYARESDGELRVSLCSRTAPLSSAQDDLLQLGEGEKPTDEVTVEIDKGNFFNINIAIYGSIIVAGTLVVLFIWRRRY